jgi:hypothetical protein
MSPCATSRSTSTTPLPMPATRPRLLYCQNFHGSGVGTCGKLVFHSPYTFAVTGDGIGLPFWSSIAVW